MKCAFCASVCAIFIATASMLPVYGGDLDVSTQQGRTVQQFNELLNSGELDQAETLAKNCFLKDSSDPIAILMLRQIFLTRKGSPTQIVFPATTMRSRVITPGLMSQGESHSVHIQFGISQPLVTSAMKSCSGSCLEPLNAVVSAQIAGAAAATQVTSKAVQPIIANQQSGPAASSLSFTQPPPGRAKVELFPAPSRDLLFSTAYDARVNRVAAQRDSESAISLHLIKGPVALLERLGIAIQSEVANSISQPRLDAAKDAVPTPITVPVLAPTTDENVDRISSPLVPLIPRTESAFEIDLSESVCAQREKIIRQVGEPLATRHLSAEERNEILKAAQAALGVSITQLPKVKLVNDQSVEMSGSVIDSAGKALGLSIHNFLTPDQRAVLLQMTFHSEQGPAALSQRVSMSDFLESEEGLLIALDAPLGATGLGVVNAERVTTYLVVSPSLRRPIRPSQPKVANSTDENSIHAANFEVRAVTAELKTGRQPGTQLETKVYPVADLVSAHSPVVQVSPPARGVEISEPDYQGLMNKISRAVAVNEWQSAGGPAKMTPADGTLGLVIQATPQMHKEIQGLLSTLRKEFNVQTVGEIRIISGKTVSLANVGLTVSPQDVLLTRAELDSRQCSTAKEACPQAQTSAPAATCEMCDKLQSLRALALSAVDTAAKVYPLLKVVRAQQALHGEFGRETACCTSEAALSAKLLTEAQLEFLLNGLQGNKDCNVVFAPKITMFNGQTGTIECGQDVSLSLKIVIPADQSSLATTVNIPAAAPCPECNVPQSFHGQLLAGESILIPLPGPCTNKAGQASDQMNYLLITPRMIIAQELQVVQPVSSNKAESDGKPAAKCTTECADDKVNDAVEKMQRKLKPEANMPTLP